MKLSFNIHRFIDNHINNKMKKASMSLKTIEINNDSISYWDNASDKPAILLVHGFGATAEYQWFKQVQDLSKSFRVIIPDLLYFGKTKASQPKFELDDQVTMLRGLLEKLGIKEYFLCGLSYGGLISMEIANNYPEGIQKLIIFDAPVKYMYKSDFTRIKEHFNVSSIEELFVPKEPQGVKTLMRLATGKRSLIPGGWYKEFHQEVYTYNREDKKKLITTLMEGLEAYAKIDYSIDIPTLMIWGDNDEVVPLVRGKLLKKHLGSIARLEVIKKGAHMPNLTKPKEFNKILLSFLKS